MSSVYLETTVISYLAANPSRDLVLAAHQQITHEWWNNSRQNFDLFISESVIEEISLGDPATAQKRLALVQDVQTLALTPVALELAKAIIKGPLPKKAIEDAFHISLAAVHNIDYLLTWNCKHIANLFIQKDLEKIILRFGFRLPQIGTPEALMEV